MTFNTPLLIDRAIRKTRRAVNAPAELFNVSNNLGEAVYVRNRNVEYELVKTQRDKYLDIQSPTDADNSPNYISITGASLGANFSPVPVGTVVKFWTRPDVIATNNTVPWMVRFGGSQRVGFMTSSGLIRFRPNWTSVGGGIASISNNGSGSVRIVTNSAHGRNTGDTVYIQGVTGTGASNINILYWEVAVINSTTLDLIGSSFTGSPTGGTVNHHIKFSLIDEDGIPQNGEDLALDKWYLVTLEIQNSPITLDSTGLHIGPYYRNTRIHIRDFRITTPSHEIYWDFRTGLLDSQITTGKPFVVNPGAQANTVQFTEDELVGNNYDLIEQASPYRLWRIRPKDGFVTPENFGAVKQFNTSNTSDDIDATAVIQACMDSPYSVLGDGYYYQKGLVNITRPKYVKLLGTTDGNTPIGRDESIGCFYAGAVPSTMYRIFAGGVWFQGGMIDVSNCIYDTANANLAPDYVPPAVFEYCYWKNLIQFGELNTLVNGNQDRTKVFNGGHRIVSFDGSRVHPGDPQGIPGGFGEMHYVDFKLSTNFCHSMIDARLGEPHQDYTAIVGHSSVGGFKVTSATASGGKFIIESPVAYVVPANNFKVLTLKWGTHSSFTIKVVNSGGNYFDRINEAIVKAGYSLNTALPNDSHPPAFRAEARSGGSNQAFTIRSNQSTFKLTCVRPCLPTVFEYELIDVGCKYTAYLETADNAVLKAFCQTANVLAERPSPVDGYTPTEWNIPKVTMIGDAINHDLQVIDLNKGNSNPTYKSNLQGWIDLGRENEPFDSSLQSFEATAAGGKRSELLSRPTNLPGFIRNARHFSHTRYHRASTGRDGFIGYLDNVMAMANKKWPTPGFVASVWDNNGNFDFAHTGPADTEPGGNATLTPGHATVSNLNGLFNIEGALCQITYNPTFDPDNDFIEIFMEGFSGLDIVAGYLEFYTANMPKKVQMIVQGSGGTTMQEFNSSGSNNWFHFDYFNNGTTTAIILRLIGAKDIGQICQVAQFAAVTKNFAWANLPFLSNAGGVRIYNTTEFEGLRIKDTGTTYRTIVPQASPPASPTTEQIRAALVAAGIFF